MITIESSLFTKGIVSKAFAIIIRNIKFMPF